MIYSRKCILGAIGAIFVIIFGFTFKIIWIKIITYSIRKEMVLSPTSPTYPGWKSSPLELNTKVYLFNWTNPDEITIPGKKPILKELGPYSFRETSEKVNIVWHPENASVSFNRIGFFQFDKEGSNGDLNDKVIMMNMLALGSAGKTKNWAYIGKKAVSVALDIYVQPISVHKTAGELTFYGYEEEMLNIARQTPAVIFGSDVQIPYDKIGFFYGRNGSKDAQGSFNVFTGAHDYRKLSQMHTWNYKTSPYSASIEDSSSGEFFPSNLKPGDTIYLFLPDLCGTLLLEYSETVEIHGIEGYKFAGTKKSVDNGTSAHNSSSCIYSSECYRSGVIALAKCKFDTPAFVSFPHYLYADPYYSNQVEGINSEKNKHEFYIVLEPVTGSVMEIAARLQINALIEPFEDINLYENVQKTFIPMIWFEQKVIITPEIAKELQNVPYIMKIGNYISISIILLGFVILLLIVIIPLRRTKMKKKNNIIHEEDEEKVNTSLLLGRKE